MTILLAIMLCTVGGFMLVGGVLQFIWGLWTMIRYMLWDGRD